MAGQNAITSTTTGQPEGTPDPAGNRQGGNDQAKHKRRAWLKGAASGMAAMLSVSIAYLAFWDQHEANMDSRNASNQAYATKVSIAWTGDSPERDLVIQNLGTGAITNVSITLTTWLDLDKPVTKTLPLGTIPGCTTASGLVDAIALGTSAFDDPPHEATAPTSDPSELDRYGIDTLQFTDQNGVTWQRTSTNALKQITAKAQTPSVEVISNGVLRSGLNQLPDAHLSPAAICS